MNRDLIEKYVYAVTKSLQSKIRKDVEKELTTLIDDMLESRCGQVTPTQHDIKVVLTELGTPSELRQKYNQDTHNCLIGPPYYAQYKTILAIVLAATYFGLTLSAILLAFTKNTTPLVGIASWLGTMVTGSAIAIAFVTVLFAIFERKGIAIHLGTDQLENLPPVPKKNEQIPRWECIVSIVFCIVFCIVFLTAPQIFCILFTDQDYSIPVFDPVAIQNAWLIILAFGALGVIRESFKLYEGRYTKRLALVTIIADVCSAALAFLLLWDGKILNPALVDSLRTMFMVPGEEFIVQLLANAHLLFLSVLLFALALEILVTVVRAFRYDK